MNVINVRIIRINTVADNILPTSEINKDDTQKKLAYPVTTTVSP